MARRSAAFSKIEGGKESTSTNTSLTRPLRLTILLTKVHYIFLAPLIILGIPSTQLLAESVVVVVVASVGLAGTVFDEKRLVIIASSTLLFLLISGKVGSDLLKSGSQDTAVLLVEFGMILYLMEASLVAVDYDKSKMELRAKRDETSQALEAQLRTWLRNLLFRQGKIAVGSIGLSILLLPLGGFTSVSIGQLPVTAALVLIAIAALLFLLTHQREPEGKSHR